MSDGVHEITIGLWGVYKDGALVDTAGTEAEAQTIYDGL